ncbi:hypothetical protein B0H13DRAFT_2476625, partial [Mycena leptocephala]
MVGGVRGVLMSIECALLACLPSLGFSFHFCSSISSSVVRPYIFSSSLLTPLYSISTTSSSCRPPSLLRVYVCSISAPLLTISTLALHARYIYSQLYILDHVLP